MKPHRFVIAIIQLSSSQFISVVVDWLTMGRIVIGSRRLPLAEFVGVCLCRDDVILDAAILSKIDADITVTKTTSAATHGVPVGISDPSDGKSATMLSEIVSRAVVLLGLVRLMHGKYQVPGSCCVAVSLTLSD